MFFKHLILLFLFYISLNVVKCYDTVECSPEMLNVYSINNLTYFQTPNYPQTISNKTFSASCYANFTSVGIPYYTIWFAVLNGNVQQPHLCESLNGQITECDSASRFDSNGDYYYGNLIFASDSANYFDFSLKNGCSLQLWTAFQAIIVLNNLNDPSCPLSTRTFDFVQNSQLIIPATNYLEKVVGEDLRVANCSWNFIINSSQQLKIVTKALALVNTSTLILFNNNVMVKNFTQETQNGRSQVDYFDGTNFTIQFISPNNQPRFFLQITAVQKAFNYTINGCQVMQQNGKITYSNIDYVNGYPPYQQCINDLIIPLNHQATLTLMEDNYEDCCDNFYVKDNQGQKYPWGYHNSYYIRMFMLKPNSNNSQMIFNSDGDTQQSGYKVEYNVFECTCGPAVYVVQCNGEESTLTPLDNNNPFYCENMNCNYQILRNQSCPNAYLEVYTDPNNDGFQNPDDYIVVKDSNGKFLQNITSDNYEDFWAFLPNGILLEFHSGNSTANITYQPDSWQIKLVGDVTVSDFYKHSIK